MPASSANSTNRRSSRPGASKTVLVLKLSPKLLSGFSDNPGKKSGSPKAKGKGKETSPASSSPDPAARPPSVDNVDNASDAASTPANGPATAAADQPGRKGAQGARSGNKRTFNQAGDTLSKTRGRPGPRKKPKV